MVNILLVEDDKDLNVIVCKHLNSNRYHATGCFSAGEAFELLYTNHYDMVISDIMMPGMDGFAFAEAIREQDKNIPILFIIVWQLNVSSCLFFWWMLGRKLGKVLFQIMGDPLQGIVEIHPLLLCHAVSAVSQCRVDPGTDFFDYSAAFLGQII